MISYFSFKKQPFVRNDLVMDELESYLSNIEKDNTYRILEVIKDSAHSRTERVLAQNGNTYIRKYFPIGIPGSENEYRLLSQLNHPALPQIYDYYELAGKGVLIEEYIEGMKLADIINIFGTLSEPKAVEITKKVCEVCIYLHQQRPAPIIHRDIKPDNIICMADGNIKLIDFGSAREYKDSNSKDTIYVGTIGYAPPEQFGFGQTDMRSDIYGIGMTMLNLLTGKTPERGQKIQLSDTNISMDIQQIIHSATQFDPAKRYISVSSMLSDLNDLVPQKSTISRIKEISLIATNDIFPKHRNWPAVVKWLFMPLHAILLLLFVVIMARNILEPSGYGRIDDIIRFSTDFILFLFVLFPPYILGLNLFNLNETIPFFHKRSFLKKIVIVFILFLIWGALSTTLDRLHSEAYKLAQNLAAS